MSDVLTTWAREIISLAILFPLVWYFIKTNQKNVEANLKVVENWFKSITSSLIVHMDEDKVQFEKIVNKVWEVSKSIGKTVLSNEQIVDIAKSKVWYASERKLTFIKRILVKNWLTERKDIIEKQLRTELDRLSMSYIEELNQYTSSVGLVWDWINENFPMDKFMEEIYKVIFAPKKDNKTRDEAIAIKLEDCAFVMKDFQNSLWNKFKKQLK